MNLCRVAALSAWIICPAIADFACAAGPPAYKATLLHPLAGYSTSYAENISGTIQVGRERCRFASRRIPA
jgi:hypothetical protein